MLRPRSEYLPVDQDTLKSGGYSDTTRPEKVALRQSSRRFFQVVGKKTVTFDRKEQIGHSYDYPAKRRRATLRSDPSRDNRMRMRRIFRPGKPQPASPPLNTAISRAASNASKKPRGSRGRAPDFCRLFKNAKIPFHAEPRQNDYIKKEILEPPALPSPGTYPPGYHSEVSLNLRASPALYP